MGQLPSGTVTLLFTDIEGSALRWESDPAAMRAALAVHDEVIVDAVTAFEGHVIKHTGDGIFAAFTSAPEAARAAIRIQHHLQRGSWNETDRLPVRIGLHSGDLDPTGGDYFGPVVNRAARTMDLANGNQIACSAITASLLKEIDTRSEGYHELRGIGIEEVFVVLSDEFDVDDRPFRLPIEPSNLPSVTTSFVGRAQEMEQAIGLLRSDVPVVGLVGPGGVGKTRLGVEIGRAVLAEFAGGVHFCELAPLDQPGAVEESVAEAIGARRQPKMSLLDSIADHVEGLGTLLILDNCEHLIESVRRLVERLSGLEGVQILLTSREPLAVGGERLLLVRPLPPELDGVQLYVERAQSQSPDFVLDGDMRRSVAKLVRHLDGIPLAIELAAAWVRVVPPSEFLRRLDDRFRILRSPEQGDRRQTLKETVRWSFDLLTYDQAVLFARLSVFAGGFTLSAVEAVCVDNDVIECEDVLDLMMALVNKSMVVPSSAVGGSRFTILETLRSFGDEVLGSEREKYRERHARWCLEVALQQNEQLFSAAESEVWSVLDTEWDNLRSAVETFRADGEVDEAAALVEALIWFALFSMRFELFSWASELLEMPGIESNRHFQNLCGAAAMGCYFTVDDRAIELAERGLASNPADPDGFCRTCLAAVYLNNVHDSEASEVLTAEWLAASPEPIGNQLWSYGLRTFHVASHAPSAEAVSCAEAASRIAGQTRSPSALALAYWAEGLALAITDRDAARELWNEGLEWARSLPDSHLFEHLLIGLIIHVQVRFGDLAEILQLCRSAVRSTLRQHYLAGASHLLGVSAIALTRAGDPDTGARLLGSMVANGHLPRANALNALQAVYGDELESKMKPGHQLSVTQATQLALGALTAAQERTGSTHHTLSDL